MKLTERIDDFINLKGLNEDSMDLFDDDDEQTAKDAEELFKHLKKYGAKKVKNMIQFKVGKTHFVVHTSSK